MKNYHLNNIESLIIEVRNQKVILDSDVATIYGVETKRVNEAVQRNLDKFPKGYILELSKTEKQEVVAICDHLSELKFSPNLPKAFTEKGSYMLATILKSNLSACLPVCVPRTGRRTGRNKRPSNAKGEKA